MFDFKKLHENEAGEWGRGGVDKNLFIKILDKFIVVCVFLTFFLCPFFFTGLTAQNIAFEKTMLFYLLVFAGVVAWAVKGVVIGELKLRKTPLDWALLFLLAIFAISTIFSVTRQDSLIGYYGNLNKSLITLVAVILFYYLVINNINGTRIKMIFWAFISSGAIVAVISLLQIFGKFILPFSFSKVNYFNPIGSMSGLTAFLGAILPMLVLAAVQFRTIHPKVKNGPAVIIESIIFLSLVLFFVLLVCLNYVAFWPALIVGLAVVLMFFLTRILPATGGAIIIPLIVFLCAVAMLVMGKGNIINLNLPSEVNLSRQMSWDIAKKSLKESPLLGSGPSTFLYDFSKYRGRNYNLSPMWNQRFDSANGLFFEYLSTVGVLGTLAITVAVLTLFSLCFLNLTRREKDGKNPPSILVAFFASALTAVIGAILYPSDNSNLLLLMLILVATSATAFYFSEEKKEVVALSFRTSPKYALASAAIFLSVSAGVAVLFMSGVKMYLADAYAKKAVVNSDIKERTVYMDKAIEQFSYWDSYYIAQANNFIGLVNEEVKNGKDQTKIQNFLSQAIESVKRAVEIAPNRAADNEAAAAVYENSAMFANGSMDWAETYYQKLIGLEPENPVPYLKLGLINIAKAAKEQDQAKKTEAIKAAIAKYDDAIARKEDFAAAYYGKGVALEGMNNTDEALKNLATAANLEKNMDYWFELARLYYNKGAASQTSASGTLVVKTVAMNDDLKAAEQIFLAILKNEPKHVNSLYSLALLYQKTGELDKTRQYVKESLDAVSDDASREAIKKQFVGLY